jgi:NAD(P)-dependent dehydrogenase (short-subunit alcohol dehydrogenase family)
MTTGVRLESDGVMGVDAVVTGAGRGLGLGIARALAAAGARVWLVSELADELAYAAKEIRDAGGSAEARVVDVSAPEELHDFALSLRAEAPRLRVLVNNAAVLERRSVSAMGRDHWDRLMGVNLAAPVFLTRDLLPVLLEEGGSIVNVSSRAGVSAFEGQTAYCASKFGIEAFTRCLAQELAGSAVSANTVTPGLRIKPTSITRADAEATDEETRSGWSDPIELGPAFVFLASLRGAPSGFRFNATTLTRFLERQGPEKGMDRISEVAEYVPTDPNR